MNYNEKPTIVFDVDGVLLKWESNLPFFCLKNGLDPLKVLKAYSSPVHMSPCDLFGVSNKEIALDLLRQYNHGQSGKYLAAYDDAIESIHKLAKEYNLVALTSFGSSTAAWMNRKYNLEAFFPGIFSDLICIDITDSKVPYFAEIMHKHNVIAFVDDQQKNIDLIQDWLDAIGNDDVKCIHLNRNVGDALQSCKYIKQVLPTLESHDDIAAMEEAAEINRELESLIEDDNLSHGPSVDTY